MDVKRISWVGNVYQKFEAMCLEIEDVVYKDTIDYVENQVQTVGQSVKKFCSEMMHDLHPESGTDPVTVAAAADFSVNPYAYLEIEKKGKKEKKEKRENYRRKDVNTTDDAQVIKGRSKPDGLYKRRSVGIRKTEGNHFPLMVPSPVAGESWERNSRNSSVCELRERVEDTCDHIEDTNVNRTCFSIENVVSDEALLDGSAGQRQEDPECTTTFDGSSSRSSGTEQAHMTTCPISRTGGANTINCGSAERSDKHDGDAVEAFNVLDQEAEEIEQEAEVADQDMEETCVWVEGDGLHIPHGPVKPKSYKKKIREAFSSKARLTMKEYQKLAAKYEEQAAERVDGGENAPPVLVRMKASADVLPSASSDFPDSEWELL
ncbi:unnamed protein product [Cuscuta epithymum]|uniref:Uncharacterized protein n=1 Tax=Cuscuta epithymum TaxID=186058 RepID=A0AAV0DF66_9ASTE|nr:unnamed protein product [Cuscuta epithymum]